MINYYNLCLKQMKDEKNKGIKQRINPKAKRTKPKKRK